MTVSEDIIMHCTNILFHTLCLLLLYFQPTFRLAACYVDTANGGGSYTTGDGSVDNFKK
jgi:hypothetical protein